MGVPVERGGVVSDDASDDSRMKMQRNPRADRYWAIEKGIIRIESWRNSFDPPWQSGPD